MAVETFATRCGRRARRLGRRTRSAGAAGCAVTGIATVASFATSNSVFTTSTTATRLSCPRVTPLIRLLNDDFSRRSHHSSLAWIVVFIVRHAMCRQLTISWNSPVGILFEVSWCATRVLWRRAVLKAWTFTWDSSFERWCCLKHDYKVISRLDRIVITRFLTLIGTIGADLKRKILFCISGEMDFVKSLTSGEPLA